MVHPDVVNASMNLQTRFGLRCFQQALLLTSGLWSISAVSLVWGEEAPLEFNRDIRPLLSSSCFACHGPDEETREADLRLDVRDAAVQDRGGYAAISPGDASASLILERITSEDPDLRMPPPGKGTPLGPAEVERLRRWIDQDAPYQTHWSYVPPRKQPLPEVSQRDWARQPIDYFILQQLERAGLTPAPEADRAALARRVALALTGLPPSVAEVEAFLRDPSPEAYERFVDLQLDKPSFGERWARDWLDLARYADSAGYADDPERTIWAYRDYVIHALNENMPFDQFTIEQIAGDLLENPTDSQLIATAFHRNTMTNSEGGTNDEQFRNEAIVDRVNTTMAVWMGTTMACAQCHTHKYDPITQHEYFQFFDFFNQSADADRRDESPLFEVWSQELRDQQQQLTNTASKLRERLGAQTPQLDVALQQWIERMQQEPSWQPLVPTQASDDKGALEIREQGEVAGPAERPQQTTWTIHLRVDREQQLAGLRLIVPPTQTSNFVLSRVHAEYQPAQSASPAARFLRVRLPGQGRILHLAELEVFAAGENIARRATASQSSTDYGGVVERIHDGNTDGVYTNNSVTHTATEDDPWIELDFGTLQNVDSIRLWNRTDSRAIEERLAGYVVELLDEQRQVVWSEKPVDVPAPSQEFTANGKRTLGFHLALADFAQDNFPASAVLPPNGDHRAAIDANKGWAIGGQTGMEHRLSLFLGSSQPLAPGVIVLTLEQKSAFGQHVLTALRFEATGDPTASAWSGLPEEIRQLLVNQPVPEEARERLATYYRSIAPELEPLRNELKQVEQQLASIKPMTTVPVMRDLPAENHRTTKVQLRGNYLSTSDEVKAGVPAAFHPLPEEVLQGASRPNRLALAKWLVDRNNPLTARVCVNRHWEQLFGTGIVETSEEFGSQGEPPSHPELLDWLAVDLMENGWDIKRMLKQMVLSATYRQSSAVTAELLEVDPQNRLYARGPRFRISAEMIRDQALAVSGLLSPKLAGPPVRPPQPQLGLSAAFGSATDWKTSEGEDRYRRAIYTTWRRSNPYPSMATFDAPNREVCTLRRSRTNTPLQALVTLNDPVYIEAAQALARKMLVGDDSSAPSLENSIRLGVQDCLLREPTAVEVQRIQQLFVEMNEYYSQRPEEAKQLAEDPLGPLPDNLDVASAAAMTVVANAMLNLDETLMPR